MSDFDQIIVGEEWENTDLSLLETLDHVLNRGLVIAGEITISVADIDLIGPRFAAVAPGEEVELGEMRGRARRYDLAMPDGARTAIGVAVSRRCDLFIAAVQGRGEASAMQRAALAFLKSQEMRTWVTAALDGR